MSGILLSQAEAAKVLGRSRMTVRRWTRHGLLPTFTDPDSGRVLYPEPALVEWATHAAEMKKAS